MTPMDIRSPSCASVDPNIWFPEQQQDPATAVAVAICRTCPEQSPCLDYALSVRVVGIWGGTTDSQRNRMRREQRIHAAPLHRTYALKEPA